MFDCFIFSFKINEILLMLVVIDSSLKHMFSDYWCVLRHILISIPSWLPVVIIYLCRQIVFYFVSYMPLFPLNQLNIKHTYE